MERNYQKFYESLTSGLNDKQKKILIVVNRYSTYLFYVSYPLLLVYVYLYHRNDFRRILIVPAISFLILSLVRRMIDRKRPYETHSIIPIIHKDTKGNSMPSRHIFSSAIISMCFLYFSVPLGIVFLILTIISSVVRVAGGVHYPSDVIAGFVAGIVCALFMFF